MTKERINEGLKMYQRKMKAGLNMDPSKSKEGYMKV